MFWFLKLELTEQGRLENFRLTDAAPQSGQGPKDYQLAHQSSPLLGASSAAEYFGGWRQFVAEIVFAGKTHGEHTGPVLQWSRC